MEKKNVHKVLKLQGLMVKKQGVGSQYSDFCVQNTCQ